jgi:peptidoglycan-associated lipoprotein
MKTQMLHLCIPLAFALLGGCASQSKNEATEATSPQSGSASPSSSPTTSSRAPSRGVRRAITRDAAGKPNERSVYYDYDKDSLSAEDRKLIEAHAQYLREHADVKIRVEGNADERGSKEYNLALGQRRAETVTKLMGLLGVKDQRTEAVSYGEEKPKAAGHDEKAWSENRRSDILY